MNQFFVWTIGLRMFRYFTIWLDSESLGHDSILSFRHNIILLKAKKTRLKVEYTFCKFTEVQFCKNEYKKLWQEAFFV